MTGVCDELLTEAGCRRRAGHAPPHCAERSLAELLDERDGLADVVARNRELIDLVEQARRPGTTPFYVILPVSNELLDDGPPLVDALGAEVKRHVERALERARGEANAGR